MAKHERTRTAATLPPAIRPPEAAPRSTGARRALGLGGLVGLGGLALGAGAPALAGPEGGVVTHGAAAIQRQGTVTTITQGTDRAALEWQSFNIDRGETVRFRQPSTSSIALNTILDRTPTEIRGNLASNGQVWLQNPQGVIFTESASVDVGGLLATTATIDQAAFAEGRGRIEGTGGQGAVINRGDIAAGTGGVALIAPVVENSGAIAVAGGSAELAAATGFSVDTHGDGLLSIVVDAADAEQLSLVNEGTIRADGGVVRLTAAQAEGVRDSLVHAGGIVEATGIAEVGGEIVITGGTSEGALALVTGQVSATKGDRGGQIAVSGAEVRLERQAVVSVSAPEGGGLIEIGPRAAPIPPERVRVAASATLTADATAPEGSGDAGDILFWSTGSTDFKGTASASASGSGDGGFVDISSAGQLGFDGTVHTSAVSGTPGELLFDPDNIIVGALGTDDGEIADGTVNASDGSGTFYISATALQTRIDGNPGGTTTLAAYEGIALNEAFTLGDHTLNLNVGPGDTPTLTLNSTVTMGADGVLNGTATNVVFGATGAITFAGANFNTEVTLTASNTLSALNPGGTLGPIVSLPPATFGGDVTLSGTNGVGIYRAITNNNGDTTLAAGPGGPLVVGAPLQSFSPGGDMGGVRLEGGTVTLDAAVFSSQEVTIAATSQVTVNYGITAGGAFDITIEELAAGNTPNVTATSSFTSYTGDLLMPTVGTVSIVGGSITGDNIDITSDADITFRPSSVDVTGDVDLTSNTSTLFAPNDATTVDIGGNLTMDAGDGASTLSLVDQTGTLNVTVAGNVDIDGGTGDATVDTDILDIGAGTTSFLDVSGGTVFVSSAFGSAGITVTGGATLTGTSATFESNNASIGDELRVTATSGAASVVSGGSGGDSLGVSGNTYVDGTTGASFSTTGGDGATITGTLEIESDGGAASFSNGYGTPVTLGSLYVSGGTGTGSITGPVAFNDTPAVTYVSLQGDAGATLSGSITPGTPPADLSVSATNVTVNEIGGAGVVDSDAIDGVFRNIDLSASDDILVNSATATLNLSGDLTMIGGIAAGDTVLLEGYLAAGGSVSASGAAVDIDPDAMTVGTTLTITAQSSAILDGTSYVSGLTTVSATAAGGTVDIRPARLDTVGLDVDAAGAIYADIARMTSGAYGMTNGPVSLVSTGGAIYADFGETFVTVNGDLEIRTPAAIDFDPESLTVRGDLTLASGTSVTIENSIGDGAADPFFLGVSGDFTIEPTAGAGAVPVSIQQYGTTEINIYVANDFGISTNGGTIALVADMDGDFVESGFGVGGDLSLQAGAGNVRVGDFGRGTFSVAGGIDIDGGTVRVFAPLYRYSGAAPAAAIDIDAAGDIILGILENPPFVPLFSGSLGNPNGDIALDTTGAGTIRLGGDVIAGTSGSYGGDVVANAAGDMFIESAATIQGGEVRLTAAGAMAQATAVGAGVPGFTVIATGTGANAATPNLVFEADSVEVFGTLDVTGSATITATGDFPSATAGNGDPGTPGLIFVGAQPAGPVTGTGSSQPGAPGTTGSITATGAITLVAGANVIEGDVTSTDSGTAGIVSITSNDDFIRTGDVSIEGGQVRLHAPVGTIVGTSTSFRALAPDGPGATHPLMLRAADFVLDGSTFGSSYSTLVGFTGAVASVGGTTGYLDDGEFERLAGDSYAMTVLANAGDGGTGGTTLTVLDISAPFGGDSSLSRVSFGASGRIDVVGYVSGGGYYSGGGGQGGFSFPGFAIELGTRTGLYGSATSHVPGSIDISGRVGIGSYTDEGGYTSLVPEPPDGISFIASGNVTTSTGLTDGSDIFFALGTSVIDVGGSFVMENTTGAPSPLAGGEPSAGAVFEALRVDRATRTEIFGTVNGIGAQDARFEVEEGAGFTPNSRTQINDCVIQAASCNLDPFGDDLFGMTDEDTPTGPIDLLDGFTDRDGGTLELDEFNGQNATPGSEIPGPDGGVFIIGSDGSVTFDPQGAFETLMVGESVSFDVPFTVSDGQGGAGDAVLTVTIDGVNDAPTAMDGAIGTDSTMVSAPLGVDEIGMDIDMDPLAFSEIDGQAVMPGQTIQLSGGGTITVGSDGSITFNPAGEVTGTNEMPAVLTVPVTVTDGNGGFASALVTITVTGANGAPIGMAGSLTTPEDMVSMTLDALGLFTDPEMQALTLIEIDGQPVGPGSRIAGPEGGVIIVGANGGLMFDPAGAFDALDGGEAASFTINVTVRDAFSAIGTAPVTISVLGIGDMLALLPGSIMTTEDMASDPLGVGTLAGEGVTGGLSVQAVGGTAVGAGGGSVDLAGGGRLIVGADGSLIFDPGEDFQALMEGGSDSLTVALTLSDGTGATGTTPLRIDISGLNDVAADAMGRIETTEDMVSGGLAPGEIAMDPDMDLLSITAIGGQAVAPGDTIPLGDGLLIVDAAGNLLFDPNGAFNGLAMDETATLTVDVTLVDPFGGSVTGPLEVVVLGLDGGLIGLDGTLSATEDMTAALAPDQLAEDPEMGDIRIVAIEGGSTAGVELPEGGRLFVDAAGNLVFDPGADFQTLAAGEAGPEQQAVVRLRDSGGEEVNATVTITVSGLNDAPSDGMGMLVTTEDMASDGFGALGVVTDIDNGAMLEVITVNGQLVGADGTVDLADGGTVRVAPDGTIVFDPAGDFDPLQVGEADMLSVVLGVSDGQGGLGEVTVDVDVTGLNDAPVAVDDGPVRSTAIGTTTAVVLENDFDPESDPIRVISVSEGAPGGTVTIGEGGVLVFDPGLAFLNLGETELVQFSVEYGITDGLDGFDTALATFEVAGINDADLSQLIRDGVLPPEIVTFPIGLVDDDVIALGIVTPDPEITFGFFNDIGIIVPTLEEEEQVTNRADDEDWPGVE